MQSTTKSKWGDRVRGELREDGKCRFWGYHPRWINREEWVPIEKFEARLARLAARRHVFYLENKEKILAREVARKRNNPISFLLSAKSWRDRNPDKVKLALAKSCAKRRSQMSSCVLTLAEKAKTRLIYGFCSILNSLHPKTMFGVDHIIPISRGGLHHPDNLRVTTKSFNSRKWAKLDHEIISMPAILVNK